MRSRKFFVTSNISIIFAAILILLAACSNPSRTVSRTNLPSDAREELAKGVETQTGAGAFVSATKEVAAFSGTPMPDGPSLLEKHCARCHAGQFLEQINKPRTEWEKTLAQMESMGVQMDDSDKVELINYLAAAQEP